MSTQARYDAGGTTRKLSRWNPPSSGPVRAVEGLQKIRDRSHDSIRNDWSSASSTQKWTTALVGTGIVPRWGDRTVIPLWDDFVVESDADSVLDLYGQQALGTRTWMDSGECFIRARWRSLAAPLAVPLQIQLYEGDQCPVNLNVDAGSAWAGLPAGNRIRQGIELNPYGRRVAYWFFKDHPGDGATGGLDPKSLSRVPASSVSHLYEPLRPGQLRGVPTLASVLVRIRNATDLEDNVLTRQQLANLFTLFITKQLPDKWFDSADVDPLTGLPKVWNQDDGSMSVGLEPGMGMELKPGENVQFANPPEAGTTYSDYWRTLQMGTSSAQGLPYELLSGDIREISDRTLRVIINEFRRYARQRQWHNLVPQMMRPIVSWWAKALLLSGQISPQMYDVVRKPKFSPHGWEPIHPTQDIEGKVKAIQGGITSRDAVIAEYGDDPHQVDEERASGMRRARELGAETDEAQP